MSDWVTQGFMQHLQGRGWTAAEIREAATGGLAEMKMQQDEEGEHASKCHGDLPPAHKRHPGAWLLDGELMLLSVYSTSNAVSECTAYCTGCVHTECVLDAPVLC